MKIRKGFVSNSSSSSFVCDVCGCIEVGMDVCLSDVDMTLCENNHTFCRAHAVNTVMSSSNTNSSNTYENFTDAYDTDGGYEIPAIYCPICQLNEVSEYDRNTYILKKYNITNEQIDNEIRSKFKTYTDLHTYLSK